MRNEACRFMAMSMANQMGSMPKLATMGTKMGTTTKAISMKSMKKPSKKMTSIAMRINVHLSPTSPAKTPSDDLKNSNAMSPPPSSLKTNENAVAPMSIINIIAVSLTVSIAA